MIKQYPNNGELFVSDNGKVYRKNKNGIYEEYCLWRDSTGYLQFSYRNNGKRYYKRVHRIVAETFIPNPLDLPQVNHKDGNKLNNCVDNLEWCNNSQNTQHGYDNGLYHSNKRQHKVKAIDKVTHNEQTFASIREMYSQLHINRKTTTAILKGEKLSNNYKYTFEYIEN